MAKRNVLINASFNQVHFAVSSNKK